VNCIANFDSGNHAYQLCRILERKGYVFEIVATPCHIATSGCGYSMRLPIEYTELVISEGKNNGIPVREIYKIISEGFKNRYVRIF